MSRGTKGIRQIVTKTRVDDDDEDRSTSRSRSGSSVRDQLAQDDQDLILMLKHKIEEQRRELENRGDSVGSIQRNFQNLSQLYQDERQRAETFDKQIREANELIAVLQKENEALGESKQKGLVAQTELYELQIQFQRLKNDLASKLDENTTLNDRVNELTKEVGFLTEALARTKTELLDKHKVVSGVETQRSEYEKMVAKLTAQFEEEQTRAKHKEFENRRLSAQIKDVTRKLAEVEQTLVRKEQQCTSLSNRVTELEADRNSHVNKLESQLKALSSQESTVKIMEAQMKRKMKVADELEEQIRLLEEQLRDKKDLQNRNSEIESELHRVVAENGSLQKQCNELERELSSKESAYSQLQAKQKQDKDGQTRQLEDQLQKVQRDRDNLSKRMQDANDRISEQLRMLDDSRRRDDDNTRQKQALQQEISRIQSALDINKQELLEVQKRVKDEEEWRRSTKSAHERAEFNRRGLESMIDDLKNSYKNEIETIQKTHKNEVDQLRKQLDEYSFSSQAQKENIDRIRKEIDEWQRRYREEEQRRQELERDFTMSTNQKQEQFREHVKQLEMEIDTLKESLAAVQQKLVEEEKMTESLKKAHVDRENLVESLKKTEKHLQTTIAKLLKTEEATESALTCMRCMGLFQKSVVCIPCGHAFCEECWCDHSSSKGEKCPDCLKSVLDHVPCAILDVLAHKCEYRKTTLNSLLSMSKNITSNLKGSSRVNSR